MVTPSTPGDLGLSTSQYGYAQVIMLLGKKNGMTREDITAAIMTALTESNLQILSNTNIPESANIPHDGTGSDHASVGLFQQQVGMWGTARELMDANTSTDKFYAALKRAPAGPPWIRAQAVQKSAFPDGSNYQKNYDRAAAIMAAMDGGLLLNTAPRLPGTPDPNSNPVTGFVAAAGKAAALLGSAEFWRRAGLFILGAVLILLAVWKVFGPGIQATAGKAVRAAAAVAA